MKTKLIELIDFEKVDTLLEGFNKTTGFVTAILDFEGNVLSKSGWRQICTEFHRINPETSKKCTISDTELSGKLAGGEKYHFYKCLNGLVDVAVPVVINGEHIANLFSGQFFFEEPDLIFFKKQAIKYGFNEKNYLEALGKVPVVSKEKVKVTMDFLLNMTQLISETIYQKLEQMELNSALKESEERFQLLFNKAPLGYQSLDFNGNFVEVNQQWLDTLGYERKEIIGKWFGDFLTPVFRDSFRSRFPIFKAQGKIQSEFEMVHKNGSVLFIAFDGRIGYDLKGEFKQTHCILQDITERRQAEKALEESERTFRKLFEESSDAILLIDETGVFVECNQAALELLKMTREQFLFLPPAGISPEFQPNGETSIESSKKMIDLAFKKGLIRFDWTHKNAEGEEFIVDISLMPIVLKGKTMLHTTWRNITERKQAEIALAASEENLTITLNSIGDGVISTDINGLIVNMNPIAEKLCGWKLADASGKPLSEVFKIMNDITRETVANPVKKVLENGEIVGLANHTVLISRNGTEYQIADSAAPIKNKNGAITGVVLVFSDVTEKYAAQVALKESEQRFKLLIENAPDGVVIIDEHGKFTYGSPYASRHFGYSENEIIGRSCHEFTHPEDLPLVLNALETIMYNPIQKPKVKYRFKRKNGEFRWIETTFTNLLSEKAINGIVLNFRDITERKKMLEELVTAKEKAEETEIQLLSILENSPAGFAINTMSTGKVKYVNKAFSEIYHIPYELCNDVNSFFEYVYGEQMELGNKILEDVKSGDPKRMEWKMVPVTDKTTKKIHYVSASNIMLKDLDLMISSVWDVTSQVENEVKLTAALHKATESDRLKSAFLANMSHEIRTPMNGILGFTSLLQEPGLTGEEQQKYIEIIQKSGDRMLSTVNAIIDISKIEAGIVTIDSIEVNVQVCLNELIRFFTPEATKKGLKLILENEVPKTSALISTDQNKLVSIFTNLIKNAIKFTPSGEIRVGCKVHEKNLEFYVKDTGIGIPSERQQVVFDRFTKADILDKDANQGSGLGLAITKAYVEMLGGEIRVESIINEGSTFYFTLPLNGQAQEKTWDLNQEEKTSQRKGLNIVIAEDDEVSGEFISIGVRKLGSEITVVKTGIEAVETCRYNPDIDLVLMDIQMPGLNGYEATRQIRQFNPEVIIIALTAFALAGDREKAIEAGCTNYISKPVKMNELLELIQKYLRQRTFHKV